jgi:hypothetical protein
LHEAQPKQLQGNRAAWSLNQGAELVTGAESVDAKGLVKGLTEQGLHSRGFSKEGGGCQKGGTFFCVQPRAASNGARGQGGPASMRGGSGSKRGEGREGRRRRLGESGDRNAGQAGCGRQLVPPKRTGGGPTAAAVARPTQTGGGWRKQEAPAKGHAPGASARAGCGKEVGPACGACSAPLEPRGSRRGGLARAEQSGGRAQRFQGRGQGGGPAPRQSNAEAERDRSDPGHAIRQGRLIGAGRLLRAAGAAGGLAGSGRRGRLWLRPRAGSPQKRAACQAWLACAGRSPWAGQKEAGAELTRCSPQAHALTIKTRARHRRCGRGPRGSGGALRYTSGCAKRRHRQPAFADGLAGCWARPVPARSGESDSKRGCFKVNFGGRQCHATLCR